MRRRRRGASSNHRRKVGRVFDITSRESSVEFDRRIVYRVSPVDPVTQLSFGASQQNQPIGFGRRLQCHLFAGLMNMGRVRPTGPTNLKKQKTLLPAESFMSHSAVESVHRLIERG